MRRPVPPRALARHRRCESRSPRSDRLARRRFTTRQTIATHIALTNDASALRKLRNLVRASQRAVLTTDALVIEVADNAGFWRLFIGIDRTALHAGRIQTVMTSSRHRLLNRRCRRAAVQEPHGAPSLGFELIETVQVVTSTHARLTARACIEIDLKRVLLAGARARQRNQLLVQLVTRQLLSIVTTRKSLDRRQILLGAQVLVDQG